MTKKPYLIEWRCRKTFPPGLAWMTEWHAYKRYKTEKDRDKALETLARKDSGYWEYRKGTQ